MCDKAMHIHCLTPPLPVIPQTSWFCADCVNCISCNKVLSPIKTRSQGLWYDRPHGKGSYRMCKQCYQLKKDGNFCQVCCHAYSGDSGDSFIECDFCKQWIHSKCDGIDEEKLKLLEQEN